MPSQNSKHDHILKELCRALDQIFYSDNLSLSDSREYLDDCNKFFRHCEFLAKSKVYKTCSSSSTCTELVPQADAIEKLIDTIWHILKAFVQSCIGSLDTSGPGNTFLRATCDAYTDCTKRIVQAYGIVRYFDQYCHPPKSALQSEKKFQEFGTSLFLNQLMSTKGVILLSQFKDLLYTYRSTGEKESLLLGVVIPYLISPLFLKKIKVDLSNGTTIDQFYLETIEQYASERFVQPKDINYIDDVRTFLIREDNVALRISEYSSFSCWSNKEFVISNSQYFTQKVRSLILKCTILKEASLERLVPMCLFGNPSLSNSTSVKSASFCNVSFACISAGKKDSLLKWFKKAVLNKLHEVVVDSTFEIDLFGSIYVTALKNYESATSTGHPDCIDEAFHEFIQQNYGSQTKFTDEFIKSLDRDFKKCYQQMEKTNGKEGITVNFDQYHQYLSIITSLSLQNYLLRQYVDKVLFRRIIMMGSEFSIFMDLGSDLYKYREKTQNLEYIFQNILKSLPKTISDERLETITEDALKSYRAGNDFADLHGLESDVVLDPLIFDFKCVPENFKHMQLDTIKLPRDLELLWQKFEQYYREFDETASNKKLELRCNLHHLEVLTPFKISRDVFLVLDVNMVQYCILELFDHNDVLSFYELEKTTQIDDVTLNQALHSFVRIKLLLNDPNDKTYKINDDFKPDRKKIKNGILRVTYGGPAKRNSKSHIPTSDSNIWKERDNKDGSNSISGK